LNRGKVVFSIGEGMKKKKNLRDALNPTGISRQRAEGGEERRGAAYAEATRAGKIDRTRRKLDGTSRRKTNEHCGRAT